MNSFEEALPFESTTTFRKVHAEAEHRNGHAQKSKTVTTPYETLQLSSPKWPTLEDAALHGLAGDIVNTIDPYTEASKVAVLITLLVMFGNCVNANAHFLVERTKHFVRLFVV